MSIANKHHMRGRAAEEFACQWLEALHFTVVARSWRPPRWQGLGEIDILAKRGADRWVFEVKSAQRLQLGAFAPVLSPRQRERLYRAAGYLSRLGSGVPVRLAILFVDPLAGRVEFLENP